MRAGGQQDIASGGAAVFEVILRVIPQLSRIWLQRTILIRGWKVFLAPSIRTTLACC